MTPSDTNSWYIVQFKPNSHKIAVRNLQRQGFETFLPTHEVTWRTVVKFETVIRPLFAGYMFVACEPETAPWQQINSTFGVSRMLSFSEGPKPIPANANTMATYVDYLSETNKSATILRRINRIGTVLKLSKNLDPTKQPEVILALKRIHRKIGRAQ